MGALMEYMRLYVAVILAGLMGVSFGLISEQIL